MIKEIVQFTENLEPELKQMGLAPKEGLHVVLKLEITGNVWRINKTKLQSEIYSKKQSEISGYLEQCILWQQNAWMIDTNKCFDAPAKAIHSCSPYCVGFKREHLDGGKKYVANEANKKPQIQDRMSSYFSKALNLLNNEAETQRLKVFEELFSNPEHELYFLKLLNSLPTYEELGESDYIIFYLDEPLENYRKAHEKYLGDKLFNTDKYNTKPNDEGLIYGTNNFFNGFNGSMPYLMHQTATFDITGRISNKEAKKLFEFQQILPRKILPNPLPIFIYNNELQGKYIGLFNRDEKKLGFREIFEELDKNHQQEFANYYLLNYQNTKDGLVFNDFDFVAKFEYELNDENGKPWDVKSLFGLKAGYSIPNVFAFQNHIIQRIFNNNLIVKTKDDSWRLKYFDEIEEKYCKSSRNYLSILKFRKAIYDFIYKSKRQAISSHMFHEMMMVSILEDIRLDETKALKDGKVSHSEYFNIIEKLNIWFSLFEKFDHSQLNKNQKSMASKLKDYQAFVDGIASGNEPPEKEADKEFMYAAGQVIAYVLNQSESADRSYKHLEPYLQKVNSEQLKGAIAHEIARYKHKIGNYKDSRFKPVSAFVLSYETEANLKKFLPELLAGLFADNQLYSSKNESNSEN
ncbi:hypothetical protein GC194_03585 [bacterium]|nr:hypothetical protein [bacterium]